MVRDLLAKFLKEGLVDLGFGPEEIFLQSDLQVAAVGWLAQHALFGKLAATWPGRVRTLSSTVLLADPTASLVALDRLFGVTATSDEREEVVATIFSQHAKFGGDFDSASRDRDQRAAAETHAEELAMVTSWAATVASSAGLEMELPQPLLAG